METFIFPNDYTNLFSFQDDFCWLIDNRRMNDDILLNLIKDINLISDIDNKRKIIKKYLSDYGFPKLTQSERKILKNNDFVSKIIALHQVDVTKIKKQIYEENKDNCTLITKNIVDKLIEIIVKLHQNNNFKSTLYGTKALQLYAPDKWELLASELDTIDIDISVENPKIISKYLFNELVKYIETNMYIINGKSFYVWKLNLICKDNEEMYTLDIEIKVKIDDVLYFAYKNSICDITSSKDKIECFNIQNNLYCQTPHHYICGLVDKLFNCYLNPRIISTGRSKISEEKTIDKLIKLKTPILDDYDKIIIIKNSESSYFKALSTNLLAKSFLLKLINGENILELIRNIFEVFKNNINYIY